MNTTESRKGKTQMESVNPYMLYKQTDSCYQKDKMKPQQWAGISLDYAKRWTACYVLASVPLLTSSAENDDNNSDTDPQSLNIGSDTTRTIRPKKPVIKPGDELQLNKTTKFDKNVKLDKILKIDKKQ